MAAVTIQRKTTRRHQDNMEVEEKKDGAGSNAIMSREAFPSEALLMDVRQRMRSRSAPPTSGKRRGYRRLVEQHFRIDRESFSLLPGVPAHDTDFARDSHDFFNLVFLVPLVVLNVMNWNWDVLLDRMSRKGITDAWTGEYFAEFWGATLLYFVIDLLWVCIIPKCVKSPSTIIQHHIATLVYVMVPYIFPKYQWCMGACMTVEVNTWFLIARRVFNKQGFPPWTIDLPYMFSIRVKLISILFYFTWITVRCVIYPVLLYQFYLMFLELKAKTGTVMNPMAIVMPLHSTFCALNMKWTYELARSKVRQWMCGREGNIDKGL